MAIEVETVVMFPGFGVGHLNPMVELGKLIVPHGLSVVFALIEHSSTIAAITDRISAAYPSITFHRLPPLPPAPKTKVNDNFDTTSRTNPVLIDFVKSLSPERKIRAMVLDFFCTDALDAAKELGVPAYFFFSGNASALSAFVSVTTMNLTAADIVDLGDNRISFPGLIPIPANHFPPVIVESEEIYGEFLYHFDRMPNADGIIVNTFEWLEPRAVEALTAGSNYPGRPMPPIYCIGPIVSSGEAEAGEKRHECLTWLDAQPNGSVVFLCFGSAGRFPKEQLHEIAEGLEKSEQRFLWVVKSPEKEDLDPDLDKLLPEGFTERTKDRGLVVKSWAPQTAVLGHVATGGFVTHCGWNSVLETVIAGVPMIAWPMYAEQRINKVFLVEDVNLAAEMKGYDKEMVRSDEVEQKLRWLMESEEGKELKKRAKAAKEAAAAAIGECGSSHVRLMEFVRTCKGEKLVKL